MSNLTVGKDKINITKQGLNYSNAMSEFFGKDVSNSPPVQSYDRAIKVGKVGRKPKNKKDK